MIARILPAHGFARAISNPRKLDVLATEPEVQLADTAELLKLAKNELNSIANSRIRQLFQARIRAGVTNGDALDQIASPSFLRQRSLCSGPEVRQLHLANLPLHPKQQSVIRIARIIDPVCIDQQRSDNAAELQQSVPVPPIACQAGSLDTKHRADPTVTQSAKQALKARTLNARSRPAEIVIDHLNVMPAEFTRPISKRVLASSTLKVMMHLVERRLANVDVRATPQVSKYPPAKPGALWLAPLKAANGVADAAPEL